MSLNCEGSFNAVPETCKDGNGLLMPKGLFISKTGFEFASKADAGDEDKWKEAVVNGDLIPLHKIKEFEDASGEDVNWESASGDVVHLYEGKYRFTASYYMTVEANAYLRTLKNKKVRVFVYGRGNNIMGTSPDGVKVIGTESSFINVHKMMLPTADTPALSKIEIQLENPTELNENIAVISPYLGTAATRWYPYNIPTNTKVTVTQIGSIATDVVTFDVQYLSSKQTDNDGNPITIASIEGLDVTTFTNFKFVAGGVVTAPSAMTEEGDGRYTATVSGITTADTIEILPTVDNVYNSDATAVTS